MLQLIEKALIEKDEDRQQRTGVKCFWGIDSVSAFTQLVRTHTSEIATQGQTAADFTNMYTSFPHDLIVARIRESASEAWAWKSATDGPIVADDTQPTLTPAAWMWDDSGYSLDELMEML